MMMNMIMVHVLMSGAHDGNGNGNSNDNDDR
jgi:hypothetical protein